jgi:hypothetical protein
MMIAAHQRRWLAASLGTLLMLLLLVAASLDTLGGSSAPQRFTLTEVTTFEAPPAPPPPPPREMNPRAGGSTGALLTLRNSRAPVTLDVMPLKFAAAEVGPLDISGLGHGIGVGIGDGTGDGSGPGFGIAVLSELDQQPVVVSAPLFEYPKEATARGIAEFDLEFQILIDEEGRTYPLAMVSNPFPSLTNEFLEYASRVRFTPPTKLGIPVRTEYVWPLKIKR